MAKLTKRDVENAEQRDRDYLLWDSLAGFGLRVWPSGRKAFFVQYRDAGGKSRRYQLGTYPTLSVEAARDAAMRALADRRDRADALHVQRARERAEHTAPNVSVLADLFIEHITTRHRKKAKPQTVREYRRLIDDEILGKLGSMKVQGVAEDDVERLLSAPATAERRAMKDRPALANNVHTVLRAMFGYAEKRKLRAKGTNPCVGWERYERTHRSQSLTPEQYTALGAALEIAERDGLPVTPTLKRGKHGLSSKQRERATGRKRGPYQLDPDRPQRLTPANPLAVAVLRFLALSGWREGEALSLRRDAIDARLQVARLADTKTGRSVRPLGTAALAVLDPFLRLPHAGNPFVFPGSRAGQHIKETKRLWLAVKHAAGVSVRLHDLRHSFTTVGRELNYADSIIAGLVGHVLEGMTSRYGDVPEATLRHAADAISETIANRLTGAK